MFIKLSIRLFIGLILNILIIFGVSANSQINIILEIGDSKKVGNYQVTNITDHKIYATITDLNGKVLGNTQIHTGKQYGELLDESDSNYPYTVGGFKLENGVEKCYAGGPVPCEVTEFYWEIGNWDNSCLNGIIAQAVVCKNGVGNSVASSNCNGLPYPSGYTSGYITGTCGICGTANGISLSTKPTTNQELCGAGTSTTVSGTGPWTWGCNGEVNGLSQDDVSCSAETSNTWACGDNIIIGSNVYTTKLMIDGNCWTSKNINELTMLGNSSCYNNNPVNCELYGRLYDDIAANDVCSKLGNGWILPYSLHFENLINKGYSGWLGDKLGGIFSTLPGFYKTYNIYSGLYFGSSLISSETIYDKLGLNGGRWASFNNPIMFFWSVSGINLTNYSLDKNNSTFSINGGGIENSVVCINRLNTISICNENNLGMQNNEGSICHKVKITNNSHCIDANWDIAAWNVNSNPSWYINNYCFRGYIRTNNVYQHPRAKISYVGTVDIYTFQHQPPIVWGTYFSDSPDPSSY